VVYSYAQKPGVKSLSELDDVGGAVCEQENLINESTPILITEVGTHRSEPFIATTAKDVVIAHLEVTRLPGTDRIVSQGACGDSEEMTLPRQLKPAVLATTGIASGPVEAGSFVGAGLLLAGASMTAITTMTRRRQGKSHLRAEPSSEIQG
jgi:hypothetical protein